MPGEKYWLQLDTMESLISEEYLFYFLVYALRVNIFHIEEEKLIILTVSVEIKQEIFQKLEKQWKLMKKQQM